MYGWYSDNSVFLEDPGVHLRPGVYSVVVLEEILVLEDPRGPIFKSSSLTLSLKLDSLSLSSSLDIKTLTRTLALRIDEFRCVYWLSDKTLVQSVQSLRNLSLVIDPIIHDTRLAHSRVVSKSYWFQAVVACRFKITVPAWPRVVHGLGWVGSWVWNGRFAKKTDVVYITNLHVTLSWEAIIFCFVKICSLVHHCIILRRMELGWVWIGLGQLFGGLVSVWVDEINPRTTLGWPEARLECREIYISPSCQLSRHEIFQSPAGVFLADEWFLCVIPSNSNAEEHLNLPKVAKVISI